MKFKHGTKRKVAQKTNFTEQYVGRIFKSLPIDSWSKAKAFANATNTWPLLWVEGTPDKIAKHVNRNMSAS